MTDIKTLTTPQDLSELTATITGAKSGSKTIYVSLGTCGIAAGGKPVLTSLQSAIETQALQDSIDIVQVGCMGLCHSEPTIEVVDQRTGEKTLYGNVTAQQAEDLIIGIADDEKGLDVIARTWYCPEDEENNDAIQARIVLRNSGRIDPEKIEHYFAQSGYLALGKVLTEMSQKDVIDTIIESGLRGRGGGGFPTGRKWSFASSTRSDEKFVICNADEGDPGAFMDRAVLEGDPHSVLEAMVIAGYAVGATTGIVYIRAEYPLAIKRLKIAIDQARAYGLLGANIFNSGFDFDIEIKYGAGAFVCGEETALIHSIEGERGEPTYKPPFPAISGLWGKPTIVNNVETYANVCAIIRKGADWFKSIGTDGSPGTKVFALAGKIKKVGLIEVPMGTKLRDIIFGVGEGIIDDKEFKSVQTGGPSGGCITSEHLDTPIDYESLKALDSMMGSGGMIVMDEGDCMVNIAKFFLEFTLEESCGKCTPCRIGNKRLHETLTAICEGRGSVQDLDKLKSLSSAIKDTALCGLGQSSPNPVLSTLNRFMGEYEAHVNDGICPAGSCTHLITFTINENCTGCTACARFCPTNCISGERKELHVIDQAQCIKCGICMDTCKFDAIDRT